ncbi:MAG: T9SS type A sorting domain-containing protein [Ignavibacteria bacterium]
MKILTVIFLLSILSNHSISQPVWNYLNSGTTNHLNRIYTKSNVAGQSLLIVGDNGTILRSNFTGLIWETINSNTSSDLRSIEIDANDKGYAVGSNGTIIKTIDGGSSWAPMQSNTLNNINEIRILNDSTSIAVGDNGTFLILVDDLWITSQIDTTDLNSFSYSYLSPNRMTVVGDYGTILQTTNSGTNWSHLNSNTVNNLNHISMSDNFVIGNNGTALQVNGSSVNVINTGTLNNLYGKSPPGYLNLICGADGTVIKDWGLLNTNFNWKLNSIIQTRYDNCFITGDDGIILYTNTLNVTPKAKQLNSNYISTWFTNDGSFNRNPSSFNAGFEWPKGENKFARYASGPLLGAIVNGDTLVTVCLYGSEYLPGYTDGGIPHGNGNAEYKIYKLTYNQIDSERLKWPNVLLGNSDQGAPVYFDSSTMTLKPVDYGNQTMFYSFTDSYPESHNQYSGETSPLKADIKQINWSFNQPEELKNIIYQEYRIINRSSDVWTNAYINLFTDDDIGFSSSDEKTGVDTSISLSYTYNGVNEDYTYGFAPPAVGFVVIRSPVFFTGNISDTVFYCEGKRKKIRTGYKETGLGSTVSYRDDGLLPRNYAENYHAIRGLQNNGTQYINPVTGLPTKFVYSGDPVTGTGWINPGNNDVRFYQGFGPLNMNPGDTQVIVIAQVIARGSSNINSITKLRETSQIAKNFYNDCFSSVVIGINNTSSIVPEDFILNQNFPNPFNPSTEIKYEMRAPNFVSLIIFDVTGKEVAKLVNEKQIAGEYTVRFDGSNLPSGIYFYKIIVGKNVASKKMMLIK